MKQTKVSVLFEPFDADQIDHFAERESVNRSEFIRQAVLEKIARSSGRKRKSRNRF